MSLGEIQQIYDLLIKIDEILNGIDVKTEKVDTQVKSISGRGSELKEVEYIFYRVTSLMRRMGLPPEINKAIELLQRAALVTRMLTTAMYYMQATTTYGQIMAIIGIVGAAVTMGSFMEGY